MGWDQGTVLKLRAATLYCSASHCSLAALSCSVSLAILSCCEALICCTLAALSCSVSLPILSLCDCL